MKQAPNFSPALPHAASTFAWKSAGGVQTTSGVTVALVAAVAVAAPGVGAGVGGAAATKSAPARTCSARRVLVIIRFFSSAFRGRFRGEDIASAELSSMAL